MTDQQNPHYVTPDEAIQKYCVFPAFNGRIQKACTGTACMAWRWVYGYDYDDTPEDWGEERKPMHSTTHGYCGMVRS